MEFNAIAMMFSTLATLLPHWPDDSALGMNIGVSAAKAGLSLSYAHGDNQWNLGTLFAAGSDDPNRTDLKIGGSYNRNLTNWGLFLATGLFFTYTVETGTEPTDPFNENLPETGTAWRSQRLSDPIVTLELGQNFWFGSRDQFGIYADAGAALPLDPDYPGGAFPIVGAGLSYRFRIN
jgi:hypothetical protein